MTTCQGHLVFNGLNQSQERLVKLHFRTWHQNNRERKNQWSSAASATFFLWMLLREEEVRFQLPLPAPPQYFLFFSPSKPTGFATVHCCCCCCCCTTMTCHNVARPVRLYTSHDTVTLEASYHVVEIVHTHIHTCSCFQCIILTCNANEFFVHCFNKSDIKRTNHAFRGKKFLTSTHTHTFMLLKYELKSKYSPKPVWKC